MSVNNKKDELVPDPKPLLHYQIMPVGPSFDLVPESLNWEPEVEPANVEVMKVNNFEPEPHDEQEPNCYPNLMNCEISIIEQDNWEQTSGFNFIHPELIENWEPERHAWELEENNEEFPLIHVEPADSKANFVEPELVNQVDSESEISDYGSIHGLEASPERSEIGGCRNSAIDYSEDDVSTSQENILKNDVFMNNPEILYVRNYHPIGNNEEDEVEEEEESDLDDEISNDSMEVEYEDMDMDMDYHNTSADADVEDNLDSDVTHSDVD